MGKTAGNASRGHKRSCCWTRCLLAVATGVACAARGRGDTCQQSPESLSTSARVVSTTATCGGRGAPTGVAADGLAQQDGPDSAEEQPREDKPEGPHKLQCGPSSALPAGARSGSGRRTKAIPAPAGPGLPARGQNSGRVRDRGTNDVVRLDGFSGGPGYSVFHGPDGTILQNALSGFYNSLKVYLAKNVVVTFPGTGYNLSLIHISEPTRRS